MAYANTSGIKLEKFDTRDKAIKFLKEMVAAHQAELVKKGWKNWTLDYDFFNNKKKVKVLRACFITNLYESSIISGLRNKIVPEIEKKLREVGRTETGSALNILVEEVRKDLINKDGSRFKDIVEFLLKNSNNARWWKRRNIEKKRIENACSIFDGTGSLETSDLNENPFGDGTDKPVLDEEYCFICEKLIKEDDKTLNFTGTDFIAHVGFCYNQGRGNKADENGSYPHFHQCEGCPRQIPKKVGKFCRTCQEKNKNRPIGECFDCHQKKPLIFRKGTNGKQGFCQKCLDNIPLCAYCQKFKCWGEKRCGDKVFVSNLEGGKGLFFHSHECRKNWEKQEKEKNQKPTLQQLKQRYLQKLTGLPGWLRVLSENERDKFKEMIFRGFFESVFKDAILQAQSLIQSKIDEEEDDKGDGFFQSEVQKIILEINSKLNQEPKVDGEEVFFDFISWQEYLLGSGDLDQLASRKEEILNNIKSIRRQRQGKDNLSQVREEVIQQIREELQNPPPLIKNEELTNPDWESEINESLDYLIINQIKTKILAEIRNIRINNSEKNNLNELLLRAHEQQNWNNYPNLFIILREIKKLRASKIYPEKGSEVEAIENQLQTLDPERFKETIKELLSGQVKDNGLNGSNTNEETKQAIDEWEANPSRENLVKAEEAICQNVADNKLIEICQEVETKLSKGNLSKKEAKKLVDKIQEIISKNDYQALAYEKNRKIVDSFLEQLNNWEGDQLEEQSLLPKWFWPVAITSCLGIVVVGVVLWMKERNKAKSNHNKY